MARVKRGDSYEAICLHWCDGDTCKILYRCNSCHAWHETYLRIRHIDSYEPSGESAAAAAAIAIKLNAMLAGKKIEVIFSQSNPENHGRLIGDIVHENGFISTWLVAQGMSWYLSSPQTQDLERKPL